MFTRKNIAIWLAIVFLSLCFYSVSPWLFLILAILAGLVVAVWRNLNNDEVDLNYYKTKDSQVDDDYKLEIQYNQSLKLGLSDIREHLKYGAKYYSILTVCDERTCDTCFDYHERCFRISDAVVGENHPPFHESCRCVACVDFVGELDFNGFKEERLYSFVAEVTNEIKTSNSLILALRYLKALVKRLKELVKSSTKGDRYLRLIEELTDCMAHNWQDIMERNYQHCLSYALELKTLRGRKNRMVYFFQNTEENKHILSPEMLMSVKEYEKQAETDLAIGLKTAN